ncbi:DUF547 domain-containing protein [Legionella israelensis]|uniref:Putative Ser/Thr protein kinase n=1 Tax=Legionella israelensis TaxID=454 RepID=A0A0W0VTA7_9GAMM|nr:DUF547 domain-containing protein [Legionella israelensis]KTD23081.1 putative Ser/Thr protein kinase [Legionella israelensis]QBS10297.1 DUF547 domain-containing protein [Legionella israelensis]SCY46498.1 Protein of unknown function, DUF547 [Legionella israelensis DSM 19235]STX59896.1 putative Ser/Thr protein kinase [Legionella israelensis]
MIKQILWILSSFLLFISTSFSAPQKNLWSFWDASNEKSNKIISHTSYQIFLDRYLFKGEKGINLVYYSKVTAEDKKALAQYIQKLTSLPIREFNQQEQLAYWINLYNALTIQLILKHWPVKSITSIHISPGFFSYGPWDAPLVTIEGQKITLNDIEHRILRPIWNTPLLHYALNCASMSCPQLQNKVFTAQNSQELMKKAAREYVNSSYGVKVEPNNLRLSKIYQWYQKDFGANESQVLKHMAQFANPKLKQQLLNHQKSISYYYNWDINGR